MRGSKQRSFAERVLPNGFLLRKMKGNHLFSNPQHRQNQVRDKILNILGVLSQSLNNNKDLFYDSQEIWDELTQRGFSEEDIEDAVSHIEKTTLEIPGPYWSDALPVHRSYTEEEVFRLSSRVRGYLWKLKCRGIIDHALEDEIVHKAMNLEDPAGLREIKTVAALTVFGYEHKISGDRDSPFCSESRLN
jgi:uncharacterized protein Smg (DUF494 family)